MVLTKISKPSVSHLRQSERDFIQHLLNRISSNDSSKSLQLPSRIQCHRCKTASMEQQLETRGFPRELIEVVLTSKPVTIAEAEFCLFKELVRSYQTTMPTIDSVEESSVLSSISLEDELLLIQSLLIGDESLRDITEERESAASIRETVLDPMTHQTVAACTEPVVKWIQIRFHSEYCIECQIPSDYPLQPTAVPLIRWLRFDGDSSEFSIVVQKTVQLLADHTMETRLLQWVTAVLTERRSKAPVHPMEQNRVTSTSSAHCISKELAQWTVIETDNRISFNIPKEISVHVTTVKQPRTRLTALQCDALIDQRLQQQQQQIRSAALNSTIFRETPQHQQHELPIAAYRHRICDLVRKHFLILLTGSTGCGKTTQVPVYLYQDAVARGAGSLCKILCTQPRRIAAISIARRVAHELGEPLGQTVGYSVQHDSLYSPKNTRLLYCTTGVLLRRLQHDPQLQHVSHIVLDEVHERTIDVDLLLWKLRSLLQDSAAHSLLQNLRIILMSATLQQSLLANYANYPPMLHIEGRSFPVSVHWLSDTKQSFEERTEQQSRETLVLMDISSHEDKIDSSNYSDASDDGEGQRCQQSLPDEGKALNSLDFHRLAQTLCHILQVEQEGGSILIFLPGLDDIRKCEQKLLSYSQIQQDCWFVQLHSSLGSFDKAFQKAPRGKRKVILGTTLMETSVTIEDAVVVLDTGKCKQNRFDTSRSVERLQTQWISRDAAQQRAGRAGRVQPGVCYRFYTYSEYCVFMQVTELSEIHRESLENLLLSIYAFGKTPPKVLPQFIEPPPPKSIRHATESLLEAGALFTQSDGSLVLSPLGSQLAQLPLSIRLGKLVLVGALLRCLDPLLTIAAALAHGSPFLSTSSGPHHRQQFSNKTQSDHLAIAYAYSEWIQCGSPNAQRQSFAKRNQLSHGKLMLIQKSKQRFLQQLIDAGFVSSALQPSREDRFELGGVLYNQQSHQPGMILAALLAGLWPQLALKEQTKPQANLANVCRYRTIAHGDVVKPHPSSIHTLWRSRNIQEDTDMMPTMTTNRVFRQSTPLMLLFTDKRETSRVFVHECSPVSPFTLLLFAAPHSPIHWDSESTKSSIGMLSIQSDLTIPINFRVEREDALRLIHLRRFLSIHLRQLYREQHLSETQIQHLLQGVAVLLRGELENSLILCRRRPMGSKPNKGNQPTAKQQRESKVSRQQRRQRTIKLQHCFACGQRGHLARSCPQRTTPNCFICGFTNHVPMDCPFLS